MTCDVLYFEGLQNCSILQCTVVGQSLKHCNVIKGLTQSAMSGASLVEGNPGLHTTSPSLPCLLFIQATPPSLYYSHFSHPTHFPNSRRECSVKKGGGRGNTAVPQQQRHERAVQ